MSHSESNSWSELEALAEAATSEAELQAVMELMNELQGPGESQLRPPGNPWVVPTLGDVAQFLGVQLPTVWGWRSGANPMPGDEGNWNLSEITQWRCDRLKALGANAKSAEQAELELAMLKEDLKKKELANRLKAKELVSREVVLAKVAEMFNEARMLIEAIPADVGPLMPPEIRNELTVKIGQMFALALRKMAQKSKGCIE